MGVSAARGVGRGRPFGRDEQPASAVGSPTDWVFDSVSRFSPPGEAPLPSSEKS